MILIKVILLIIYTFLIFRVGQEYQIRKTIEFCDRELRRRGVDPDKIGDKDGRGSV